jgi:hypothetical protein
MPPVTLSVEKQIVHRLLSDRRRTGATILGLAA